MIYYKYYWSSYLGLTYIILSSIGSLAKELEEEGVENVTVKKAVFVRTDNGLRIKSWPRHSKGFVERVRFLGARMVNVSYPILIDQNYCPGDSYCPTEVISPLMFFYIA